MASQADPPRADRYRIPHWVPEGGKSVRLGFAHVSGRQGLLRIESAAGCRDPTLTASSRYGKAARTGYFPQQRAQHGFFLPRGRREDNVPQIDLTVAQGEAKHAAGGARILVASTTRASPSLLAPTRRILMLWPTEKPRRSGEGGQSGDEWISTLGDNRILETKRFTESACRESREYGRRIYFA